MFASSIGTLALLVLPLAFVLIFVLVRLLRRQRRQLAAAWQRRQFIIRIAGVVGRLTARRRIAGTGGIKIAIIELRLGRIALIARIVAKRRVRLGGLLVALLGILGLILVSFVRRPVLAGCDGCSFLILQGWFVSRIVIVLAAIIFP